MKCKKNYFPLSVGQCVGQTMCMTNKGVGQMICRTNKV